MRAKHKFHAIALTAICAVITGLYFLLAPPPPPAAPVDTGPRGDRYIQIYSATWGRECNDYIQQELTRRTSAPPVKNEKGEVVTLPPLQLVTTDNVLPVVSKQCDGKMTCDIRADSQLLGIEPQESCFKKLEVSYRCFAIDPLRSITIEQRNTKTIDCNPNEPAANPATAQTPQQ